MSVLPPFYFGSVRAASKRNIKSVPCTVFYISEDEDAQELDAEAQQDDPHHAEGPHRVHARPRHQPSAAGGSNWLEGSLY